MAKARDAVLIDSTALDLDEVVSVIVSLARQRADAAWSR
jgi:cytidylate kinase